MKEPIVRHRNDEMTVEQTEGSSGAVPSVSTPALYSITNYILSRRVLYLAHLLGWSQGPATAR
jgi:hypothetical protein